MNEMTFGIPVVPDV